MAEKHRKPKRWAKKKNLKSMERWCYYQILSISYKGSRTNESVLKELVKLMKQIPSVYKCKIKYLRHTIRNRKEPTHEISHSGTKKKWINPQITFMDKIRSATATFQIMEKHVKLRKSYAISALSTTIIHRREEHCQLQQYIGQRSRS